MKIRTYLYKSIRFSMCILLSFGLFYSVAKADSLGDCYAGCTHGKNLSGTTAGTNQTRLHSCYKGCEKMHGNPPKTSPSYW
jgi:hypothetical protein